jgi:hypothetical protein
MRTLSTLLLLSLASCTSSLDRGALRAELARGAFVFSDVSVAEAEAIRPQVSAPFRLGIAPPITLRQRFMDLSPVWSAAEQERIRAWAEELQARGVITDYVLLPALSVGVAEDASASERVQACRVAAARQQVDVLLVTQFVAGWDDWLNPLSVLDLTIVGAWVAPGHSTEAVVVAEGIAFDNRNEYVYATASAEARKRKTLPLAYFDHDRQVAETRVEALDRLAARLVDALPPR